LRARFLQSTAAILAHHPVEGPLDPGSFPTLALFDRTNAEVIPPLTEATIGPVEGTPVSTDLDMASGVAAGERALTLTSAADVLIGGRYWVGDLGTPTLEQVRVSAVDLVTDTVTLVRPLRYGHEDAEDFLDGRLSYALTPTDTATLGTLYRVEWSYEVDEVTLLATRYFDVVLRRFQLQITEDDLDARIPAELLGAVSGMFDVATLIRTAEDDILRWLRANRYSQPDRVLDVDQFSTLGILGCKRLLLQRVVDTGDVGFESALDRADQQWQVEADRILAAGIALVDANDNLVADEGETEIHTVGRGLGSRIFGVV
jgi:hypothetical protein